MEDTAKDICEMESKKLIKTSTGAAKRLPEHKRSNSPFKAILTIWSSKYLTRPVSCPLSEGGLTALAIITLTTEG